VVPIHHEVGCHDLGEAMLDLERGEQEVQTREVVEDLDRLVLVQVVAPIVRHLKVKL
jgi:hypothetical protein